MQFDHGRTVAGEPLVASDDHVTLKLGLCPCVDSEALVAVETLEYRRGATRFEVQCLASSSACACETKRKLRIIVVEFFGTRWDV